MFMHAALYTYMYNYNNIIIRTNYDFKMEICEPLGGEMNLYRKDLGLLQSS